jgi:hypothetical protein
VLLAPDSVARSNFLKRHEIVSFHALPLKIETLFSPSPHRGTPLPRQRPHTGAYQLLIAKASDNP